MRAMISTLVWYASNNVLGTEREVRNFVTKNQFQWKEQPRFPLLKWFTDLVIAPDIKELIGNKEIILSY